MPESGWTLHFTMEKRATGGYPASQGVHPVPEMIDRRRRDRLDGPAAQHLSRFYVSLAYKAPHAPTNRDSGLFRKDASRTKLDPERDLLVPFVAKVQMFADMLRAI